MIEKENTQLSCRLRKRKVWCSAIVYFYGPLHFCAQYGDNGGDAIGALYQKCNVVLVGE
jgi:hypothetical protein